jgi:hypothetical protein
VELCWLSWAANLLLLGRQQLLSTWLLLAVEAQQAVVGARAVF